jgi:hypothetical protein
MLNLQTISFSGFIGAREDNSVCVSQKKEEVEAQSAFCLGGEDEKEVHVNGCGKLSRTFQSSKFF